MTARCTMSFDAPTFFIKSSTLHMIDLKKVRSAKVWGVPELRKSSDPITILFCDKKGYPLYLNNTLQSLIIGDVVTEDRHLKSFDKNILDEAFMHNALLKGVKVEKDPCNADYWKVTISSLAL